MRIVNQKTLNLIKSFEGLHDGDKRTPLLEPQRDPIGIWTIGWGSIWDMQGRRVTRYTPPITLEEAEKLLVKRVQLVSRKINPMLKIYLPDDSFGALVSFAYNVGVGAFRASTLRRRVNSANWADVPRQFRRWNKAGGKILKGLIRRREAEAEQFIEGLLDAGYIIYDSGIYYGKQSHGATGKIS